MASTYMTPGVYIVEKNAFPSSAVAVETAVPIFIGYTEVAVYLDQSLINVTTRITSLAEYIERFGAGFKTKFTVSKKDTVNDFNVVAHNTFYLYNSIRMFFANGGSTCYILAVGTYGGKPDMKVSLSDFMGSDSNSVTPFKLLTTEFEPTLVVVPDAVALGAAAYQTIYQAVLQHCGDMQSRFAIFDLKYQLPNETTEAVVAEFRDGIGMSNLNMELLTIHG